MRRVNTVTEMSDLWDTNSNVFLYVVLSISPFRSPFYFFFHKPNPTFSIFPYRVSKNIKICN